MKKPLEENLKQQRVEAIVMGLFSAVFFVIWGLIVNWEHGVGSRWQVAITQGVVSFASTAWSAWLIGGFVRRLSGSRLKRSLIGGGMSWAAIYSVISFVHLVAGTPDIIETMAPGLLIGLIFCMGYGFRVTGMP